MNVERAGVLERLLRVSTDVSPEVKWNMRKEGFSPSTLKITDMRTAVVTSNFDPPIIRIDTNQGVYGLGECYCSSQRESALMYKGLLLGKNPTNIDELLRARLQRGYNLSDTKRLER